MCRSVCADGSAMFTIEASRTIISWAAASTVSAHHRRGSGSSTVPGSVAWTGLAGSVTRTPGAGGGTRGGGRASPVATRARGAVLPTWSTFYRGPPTAGGGPVEVGWTSAGNVGNARRSGHRAAGSAAGSVLGPIVGPLSGSVVVPFVGSLAGSLAGPPAGAVVAPPAGSVRAPGVSGT